MWNCFTEVEDFTKIISNKPDIFTSPCRWLFSYFHWHLNKGLNTYYNLAGGSIYYYSIWRHLAKENISLIPYTIENLMFNSLVDFFFPYSFY